MHRAPTKNLALATAFAAIAAATGCGRAPARAADQSSLAATDDARDAGPVGVDVEIQQAMAEAHIEGLTVSVTRRGTSLFEKGYGLSADAVLPAGSITKVVTGFAVMQLVESGRLALDADINGYLPFPVRNARYPHVPVTLRELLSHNSGLTRDGNPQVVAQAVPAAQASSMTLAAAMTAIFKTGDHFSGAEPGTHYAYSNLGVALAGLIVERAAEVPWEQYVQDHILAPLAMHHSWPRLGTYTGPAAPLYRWTGDGQVAEGLPTQADPYFPCGGLLSTAADLARLAAVLTEQGTAYGATILAPASVATMLAPHPATTPEVTTQGLVVYGQQVGGELWMGHEGRLYGATADLRFRESDGLTIVVATNADDVRAGSPDIDAAISRVEAALAAAYGH